MKYGISLLEESAVNYRKTSDCLPCDSGESVGNIYCMDSFWSIQKFNVPPYS